MNELAPPSPNNNPVWWPATDLSRPPSDVVAVSANYNTKPLIARLLWSLYKFLGSELRAVVVVDNGSADGSTELLQAVAEAGLCKLIVNTQNRGHGPALSQGISFLAGAQQSSPGDRPWVWLLDSDAITARADAAAMAIAAASAAGAALIGESYWNPWNAEDRFYGCSVLLDPAQTWQVEIGPIPDDGDPLGEFEQSCRRQGVPALSFPFTHDGYVIHLGRATLAEVRQRGETANPHYEWAQRHYEPHFQGVADAVSRYAALIAEFEQQVPDQRADALIQACRRA